MAITTCYPSPKKQQQTVITYDPKTGQYMSSIIEHWIVTVDDFQTRAVDIPELAHANTLPPPNAPLPLPGESGTTGINNNLVIVKRVQPEKASELPGGFTVQIEYEFPTLIFTSGQKYNASLSIDGVDSTIPVDVDKDGNAIANSAGDPYDPQQVIDDFEYELVTISYQTDTPPESDLSAARGMVNSDSVSITIGGITKSWSARQMKLKSASLSAQFDASISGGYTGASMWAVKIDLLCKRGSDTFQAKLVDQGFQYWTGSGSTLQKLKFSDAAGNPCNTPQYLNGAGSKLSVSAGSSPTVTSPFYNTFKIEDQYTFDSFLGGI